MTFQDRITQAFEEEAARRADAGESRLTKTDIWKAADATSGAATHWFNGSNGMDMATCMKVASLLRVNPQWLYDGAGPKRNRSDGSTELQASPPLATWPFPDVSAGEYESLSTYDKKIVENLIRSMLAEKLKNPRPPAPDFRGQMEKMTRASEANRRHGKLQHMQKK